MADALSPAENTALVVRSWAPNMRDDELARALQLYRRATSAPDYLSDLPDINLRDFDYGRGWNDCIEFILSGKEPSRTKGNRLDD